MIFKVGDKVRLKKEEIEYYHEHQALHDWAWEAPDVFVSGRVFTITEIDGNNVKLGDDVGWWGGESLFLHESLPGDLFEI